MRTKEKTKPFFFPHVLMFPPFFNTKRCPCVKRFSPRTIASVSMLSHNQIARLTTSWRLVTHYYVFVLSCQSKRFDSSQAERKIKSTRLLNVTQQNSRHRATRVYGTVERHFEQRINKSSCLCCLQGSQCAQEHVWQLFSGECVTVWEECSEHQSQSLWRHVR